MSPQFDGSKTILRVKRRWLTDKSSIGESCFDNSTERECFTLEDRVRADGRKVYGKTAIPAGEYEVLVSYSNRFKKLLPVIVNVPNFEGIRIHPGNTDADTEGCILVGMSKGEDIVYESRQAFASLFEKIRTAMESSKVFIVITDEIETDTRTPELA